MLISDLHDLTEAMQWCDVCRTHKDGCCGNCGEPFMRTEQRYRSQSFHYHPASLGGVAGVRSVQKELCVACYRIDFANVYPEAALPDLPDRGVDPRFHAAQRREEERKRMEGVMEAVKAGQPVTAEDQQMLARFLEVGLRFA